MITIMSMKYELVIRNTHTHTHNRDKLIKYESIVDIGL